jgi:hypothetical protein
MGTDAHNSRCAVIFAKFPMLHEKVNALARPATFTVGVSQVAVASHSLPQFFQKLIKSVEIFDP